MIETNRRVRVAGKIFVLDSTEASAHMGLNVNLNTGVEYVTSTDMVHTTAEKRVLIKKMKKVIMIMTDTINAVTVMEITTERRGELPSFEMAKETKSILIF